MLKWMTTFDSLVFWYFHSASNLCDSLFTSLYTRSLLRKKSILKEKNYRSFLQSKFFILKLVLQQQGMQNILDRVASFVKCFHSHKLSCSHNKTAITGTNIHTNKSINECCCSWVCHSSTKCVNSNVTEKYKISWQGNERQNFQGWPRKLYSHQKHISQPRFD